MGWGFLFAYWFIVDRHGLRPRDDKVWGRNAVWFGYNTIFVIARRERSEGRGNPSCLEDADGFVSSLTGSQWIATGFALAMTRCEVMQCAVRLQHALVIARRRAESRDAAIHRGLRGCEQMMELAY